MIFSVARLGLLLGLLHCILLLGTEHTPGAQARTYFLAIVVPARMEYVQMEHTVIGSL